VCGGRQKATSLLTLNCYTTAKQLLTAVVLCLLAAGKKIYQWEASILRINTEYPPI